MLLNLVEKEHHSQQSDEILFTIDFAPDGKWENAKDGTPLENYAINIKKWTSSYFDQ